MSLTNTQVDGSMRYQAKLSRNRLMLALLLLLAIVTCKPSTPPPTHTPPPTVASTSPTAPVELKGRVRVVDPKAQTLEVITAVGHAARLERLEVADTCRIRISNVSQRLESLEAGTTVRVGYIIPQAAGQAAARKVAVTIEALRIEELGDRQ